MIPEKVAAVEPQIGGMAAAPAKAPFMPLHIKPVRGLMATSKNPKLEGKFGRMFKHLPAATYGHTDAESRANLKALGEAMTGSFDAPKDGFDPEEGGNPALYTYFGQFIDHDLTFDPNSTLVAKSDPDALTDFRTPAFDMDNVYGRGKDDQPYLYDGGFKFLLGKPLANGAPDLPRNDASRQRAIIGDPRNDENSIVSQFQGLVLRLHNRTVDDHPALDFDAVQQLVRFQYQWIVLHDFLPRIVSTPVLDQLRTGGHFDRAKIKFFHWNKYPFMPVEFSVAAYRLGHSMIRPGYRLNDDDSTLLPIFPVPSQGLANGLTGFEAMAPNRGIDWGRFIDIDIRPRGSDPDKPPITPETKKRLQFAYRVDTSIVNPLMGLPQIVAPDAPPSLAERNLLRSFELGLPTGQKVAAEMGVPVLSDDQITIGKFTDPPEAGDVLGTIASLSKLAPFKGNTPLWTYILAETLHHQEKSNIPVSGPALSIMTPKLGPVGGRIVAEVFLGLVFADKNSYLNLQPNWQPPSGPNYALKDFVNYALGN